MQQFIEFAGNNAGLFAGFAAVVLLLVWTEISRRFRGYQELTPVLAVQRINHGNAAIVDISPQADFAKGHLSGAKHFAMSRFNQDDKDVEELVLKQRIDEAIIVCHPLVDEHQGIRERVGVWSPRGRKEEELLTTRVTIREQAERAVRSDLVVLDIVDDGEFARHSHWAGQV